MKPLQKIYTFNVFAKIIPQGIAFSVGILLVRKLGIEDFGSLTGFIILSQLIYFSFTSGFITNYLRDVEPLNNSLNDTLLIILKIGILAYVPFIFFMSLDNGYKYFFVVTVLWFTTVLIQVFNLYTAFLRKKNEDVSLLLIQSTPYIILVLLLSVNDLSILRVSIIYLLSWLIPLPLFYAKKIIPFPMIKTWGFNSKTQTPIILGAKVLIINTIFTQVNANADQVLLKSLIDSYTLGYYRVTFVVSNMLTPILGSFSFIYISSLQGVKSIQKLNLKLKNQIILNTSFALIFAVFIYIFAKFILIEIYKISNPLAIQVLQILPIGLIFNAMAQIISYTLFFLKKEQIVLYSLFFSSTFNVVTNIILIPLYGVMACAIINIITQAINLTFLLLYYQKLRRNVIIATNYSI